MGCRNLSLLRLFMHLNSSHDKFLGVEILFLQQLYNDSILQATSGLKQLIAFTSITLPLAYARHRQFSEPVFIEFVVLLIRSVGVEFSIFGFCLTSNTFQRHLIRSIPKIMS